MGQEVLYGDIQRFNHDLGDIHTLTLKIEEDIEFQKGINVKLKPGKSRLEIESISSVWTLETNTYGPP
jgi:hypothetical protein